MNQHNQDTLLSQIDTLTEPLYNLVMLQNQTQKLLHLGLHLHLILLNQHHYTYHNYPMNNLCYY